MAPVIIPAEKAQPLNSSGYVPVMVHVTAPADLPGGYTFEANLNGNPDRVFTATVPEGGVKEGQVFLSPLPDTVKGPHLNIPTGAWKDPLCACCRTGPYPPIHPHVLCALFCPQILMGQVMTRLQLTWLGEPGPLISTRNTFNIVVTIVFCYFVYSSMLQIYSLPYDVNTIPPFVPVLKALGSIFFSIWSFYSLCKTRENTRARYSIPEERCHGCEDCCCAFFCTCCTVAQLARHTGDYENYPGTCCTSTGLPYGAPLAV